MDELLATPLGFTEKLLGLEQHLWQAEACLMLEDLSGRLKTAVVSPNGAGKSQRVVAPAALFVPFIYPQGKVKITTADAKQLDDQIIPAIERHIAKFEGWESKHSPYYQVKTPTGGGISAFTTDDPGRVEGSHQELPDGPLLWVVDEAKTVTDENQQAVDRCGYTWLLKTSTPGLMGIGRFWKDVTERRGNGKDGTYKVIQVGAEECPHKDPKIAQDIIASYGIDHPFTRSTVFGEFMAEDQTNRFCCSLSSLERCLRNPPPERPGGRVAFCDFAGGGDENVIALRSGNRITLEAHWREKDKLAAVGRFIQHFRRLELKEDAIYGDASAKDMCDLLSEAGWTINRINFGKKPENDSYISWGAYAWLSFANAVEKCEIILPFDETLKAQLTTRMKHINRTGKWAIEDKYYMSKERNLPSPDRGDAVVGVWTVYEGHFRAESKEPFSIPSGYVTSGAVFDELDGIEGLLAKIGADPGV